MSFPDKIQEIIFAHGRCLLRRNDNSDERELTAGYAGIDTIEATDKIIELIESEIIGSDDAALTNHTNNQEYCRNRLRKVQRLKLHEQKGERSNPKLYQDFIKSN